MDVAHHPATDANLGGGLAILFLALLGLPWSIYLIQGGNWMGDIPVWQQDVVWALPAVLNVVLHLGAVAAITHFRGQQARRYHTRR